MKAVQLFKQQKQRIKTSKNKTTVMFDAEHFFLFLNLDILTLIFFFCQHNSLLTKIYSPLSVD